MEMTLEQYKQYKAEQSQTPRKGVLPTVGKFLGMEEFGKGIGQAAFKYTPEYKDLERLTNEGRVSPEQFTEISTGGLKNREVIGSAIQTGLNTAGFVGKLPGLGATIKSAAIAGGATGAAFGGAEGLKTGSGVIPSAIKGAIGGALVGSVLQIAAKAIQGVSSGKASEYLMGKALRQKPQDLALERVGKRPVLAKQALQRGISGSEEKMVETSAAKIADLETKIQEAIVRNKNTSIDTVKLVRAVDSLTERKRNVFGQKGVEAINEYKKFLLSKGDKIALPEVHKFVRDVYKELGDAAFEKETLPLGRQLLKSIAGAARGEMGRSAPMLDKLIKEEQVYIRIIENLERQMLRANRLNSIGLSDTILASGGVAAGDPVIGLTAGLIKRGLETAGFKTRAAVGLQGVGNALNKLPLQGAGNVITTGALNATGSLVGENPSQGN